MTVANLSAQEVAELAQRAKAIRRHIVSMVTEAQSGHPGGSLSAADILTLLYFKVMNIDAAKADDAERDRFVLSKGHAAPVLYATLAEKGFFPVDELLSLRRINSRLQGHPSRKDLPGMALAARLDGSARRIYALLGDGELEEGMVWEAAMFAAHYKLDNLIAFVDFNGLQIDGLVAEVLSPLPIDKKFEAFGWNVIIADGHDLQDLYRAVAEAKTAQGKPSVIIARTVKGKGVSKMENVVDWHGKAPSVEECCTFLSELQD